MPTPPIAVSTLKGRVADELSKDVGDLEPKWDGIVSDSLNAAWQEVIQAMAARGLSAAQAVTWARAVEFTTDIGLFWCLTKGGMLGNYSDLFIKKIDRREELAKQTFLDSAGNLIVPATNATGGGAITSGRMSEADYRFNMDTEF